MTREEVYKDLNEIFCDVLDLEEVNLEDSTTADDVDGWDSLAHINLIVAIERNFKCKFTMNEVVNLKNVGQLADLVISKITE